MCKTTELTYSGRGMSLNRLIRMHWSKRNAAKKDFEWVFKDMFSGVNDKYTTFTIFVFYNSREDVDNVSGLEKFFTDYIKGNYVIDDNKAYFKGVFMIPDESLPHNTYEFIIQDAATRDVAKEMRDWLQSRKYNI